MTGDYLTFHDVYTHLVEYERVNPSTERQHMHRRAVFAAMREIATVHKWSYYQQLGRISTVAKYDTGTISYDHTGGTYERQVTLTSGTWPTWAAFGTIVISSIAYDVADRKSDTVITLTSALNPGADVAALTTYDLFRDSYVLPVDVWTIDQVFPEASRPALQPAHPRTILASKRYYGSAGTPCRFTVIGSRKYQGLMDIVLDPYPTQAETYDFVYSRQPAKIAVQDAIAGTVSVTASGTTVTGDSTEFSSNMVGALIRLGTNAKDLPTGNEGGNPFDQERTVMSVASTTSLTVDAAWTTTRTGVKYVISSPIDIDLLVMGNAFFRCCENQLAKLVRLGGPQGMAATEQLYQGALLRAREADVRLTTPMRVGGTVYGRRLSDFPGFPDVADVE